VKQVGFLKIHKTPLHLISFVEIWVITQTWLWMCNSR